MRFPVENVTDLDLNFNQLSVWTTTEKSWFRKNEKKKYIIKNVSGSIKRGEFTALLGPSGAGKTMFLSTLAGKCQLQRSGTVKVGGHNVTKLARGFVDMVPQHDRFMDSLTVGEHLEFMTEMKLGNRHKPYNRFRLEVLLQELMLKKLINTVIRNLSGGENRLLSLATSLLSRPQVILCDEPTTGLDTVNASLVLRVMKQIAAGGVTVLCSIHQPSSGLFAEFDTLMLMAEGRLLFHGTHKQCAIVFENNGHMCPKNYNPAEFYIKVISTDGDASKREFNAKIKNYYRTLSIRYDDECKEHNNVKVLWNSDVPKIVQPHWMLQVYLLIWRYCLTLKQDWKYHVFRLSYTMFMSGLVVSLCYSSAVAFNQRGIVSTIGLLSMISSEICYNMAYNALHTFSDDLTLLKREAGVYSCSAFYVSRLLCYIPRCIIWPIGYVYMITLAVDFPNKALTILQFILALMVNSVAATAYGLGVGAIFCGSSLVNEVLPCFDFPMFLLSGIFIQLSSLPTWVVPFKYLSQFFYGLDALNNIYWRQVPYIECDTPVSGSCVTNGMSVLEGYGYSSSYILTDGLGFLFIAIVWSLLGYVGVLRETKKGYAY